MRKEIVALVGSALLMWVAVMAKATLVLMALVLATAWVLHALKSRHVWEILLVALGLLLSLNASWLPVTVVEARAGVDLGDGQPLATNIAMGLTWSDVDDLPGWYGSTAFDCFNECEGDMGRQQDWVNAAIAERFKGFASNPAYAATFFGYKLATEWLDPTYQALWFSQTCLLSLNDAGVIAKTVDYGNKRTGNVLLVSVLDGLQTLLYVLLAVGFWLVVRAARTGGQVSTGVLMLCGMALVGFLCYVFWEAQSMYILPFVLTMMPVAGLALDSVAGAAGRGRARG